MRLKRCPHCKRHLVRWGGRLLCANAQCPGSPLLEPDNRHDEQLQLPIPTKEAA
jgi:uncharacterized Zn finger protein (UPF0148 family)